MRLAELSAPHAARLLPAQGAAEWSCCCCCDPRVREWIAWNVREDTWYGPTEFAHIQAEFDAHPDLSGPQLLVDCIQRGRLRRLRGLTAGECGHLPGDGFYHVAAAWLGRRFDLVSDSAWDEGSLPAESRSAWKAGQRLQVRLRAMNAPFVWLTFASARHSIPDTPDDTLCQLGLAWDTDNGPVLRISIPIQQLRKLGAVFYIPTIFDGLYVRPDGISSDWRARPGHEHHPSEPWGYTRHLDQDGPALPEVIADLTRTNTLTVTCLGSAGRNWSERPYLKKNAPR